METVNDEKKLFVQDYSTPKNINCALLFITDKIYIYMKNKHENYID